MNVSAKFVIDAIVHGGVQSDTTTRGTENVSLAKSYQASPLVCVSFGGQDEQADTEKGTFSFGCLDFPSQMHSPVTDRAMHLHSWIDTNPVRDGTILLMFSITLAAARTQTCHSMPCRDPTPDPLFAALTNRSSGRGRGYPQLRGCLPEVAIRRPSNRPIAHLLFVRCHHWHQT